MNRTKAIEQTLALLNRKPWILAAAISLFILVWMISGSLVGAEEGEASDEPVSRLEKHQLTKVRAEKRSAISMAKMVRLHGRTEADRHSSLRAEVSGKVEGILVKRGAWVEQGQALIRLAQEDKLLRLQKAQASLKQRQLEFEGANKLRRQGLNAQTKLAEAEANLELAKAEVEDARLALERTEIRAPFAGIFNDRKVEVGDHVSVGAELGELLDVDPIIIRGNLPELEFANVKAGAEGIAELINGEEYKGHVRYLSSNANDATHTFRVELAIANPQHNIPVGVSASIGLKTKQVLAYKVSPAILTLGETGGIGIKVLDSQNKVHFKPVELVSSEVDGSWVSGLAAEENIITVGQGFVADGDEVEVDFVSGAVATEQLEQTPAEKTASVELNKANSEVQAQPAKPKGGEHE